MSKVSTACGDWHESWGFSTNKLGRLSTEDGHEFVWKGHSQGRHGQVWNKGAMLRFTLVQDEFVELERKGGCPGLRHLLEAVEHLRFKMTEQAEKQARKEAREAKKQAKELQHKLDL